MTRLTRRELLAGAALITVPQPSDAKDKPERPTVLPFERHKVLNRMLKIMEDMNEHFLLDDRSLNN